MDYLKKLGRSPAQNAAGRAASSSEKSEPQGRAAGRSSSVRIPDALSSLLARRSNRRSQSMDLESGESRQELVKLEAMQYERIPFEVMLKEIDIALLPAPPEDTRSHAEIKAQRRERYDIQKRQRGLSQQLEQTMEQRLQERLQYAASLKLVSASAPDFSNRLPPVHEHPSGSDASSVEPSQNASPAKSAAEGP
ncbi:hypothetical protein [Acidovorax sp. SUPP3334]|uniref:hypothetical protein n=1 Tax=Acidovorax sp. SUPP3334 TaxID=2920881 RepID=UPI0023DE69D3|nr:hypothetical protein [Acidovorax sp. SUPP3334]GKT20264.1 hypothetical protein AVHM3334_00285 [Acidovorax sp. SUPP3334]